MIERNFELNSLENVEFRIYTIGYSRQGESILTILCNKEQILYSVLTDSFQKQVRGLKKFNVLDEILTQYDNPHIDLFVWTHPDQDHSIGIEDALDTYDSDRKAFVFVPDGLDRKDKYEICGKSKDAFDYLNKYYFQRGHGLPISVSSQEERKIVKLRLKEIETGVSIWADFIFIAPSGEVILKRTANENKFTINEMSVVYAINMNGRNFLFTGDFEGSNLQLMSTERMELLKFLKVPHHASYRSNSIVGKIMMHNTVELTQTVTQKGRTPSKEELDCYLKTGQVYVASDDTRKDHQYGYVLAKYGVRDASLIKHPLLVGNAYQHQ